MRITKRAVDLFALFIDIGGIVGLNEYIFGRKAYSIEKVVADATTFSIEIDRYFYAGI